MRAIYRCGLALTCFASMALAGDNKRTFKISGTLIDEAHYCGGGARPTEEMIRAAERSSPMGGVELMVVPGDRISTEKPIATAKTDPSGRFELKLPEGTWCVFRSGRQLKAEDSRGSSIPRGLTENGIDQNCLEELKHRCDEVLKVVRDSSIKISILEGCSEPWNQPCYRGPMPP